MAEQDSRSPFWTSLPGILTGTAALIGAISGLTIWHNKQSAPRNPDQKRVVEPAGRTDVKAGERGANGVQETGKKAEEPPAVSNAGSSAAAVGTRDWCAEKYKAWADLKATTGADDAGLRRELTKAHCAKYNFILGKAKPAQ